MNMCMAFVKPPGLIKPSKADCGILPDIQSGTSLDDFAMLWFK